MRKNFICWSELVPDKTGTREKEPLREWTHELLSPAILGKFCLDDLCVWWQDDASYKVDENAPRWAELKEFKELVK